MSTTPTNPNEHVKMQPDGSYRDQRYAERVHRRGFNSQGYAWCELCHTAWPCSSAREIRRGTNPWWYIGESIDGEVETSEPVGYHN